MTNEETGAGADGNGGRGARGGRQLGGRGGLRDGGEAYTKHNGNKPSERCMSCLLCQRMM
jgi:hypothetical protein